MTPLEAWVIARRPLADELGHSVGEVVFFVDDADVIYDEGDEIIVGVADLFGLAAYQWESMLEPGPVWIHFNLLPVEDDLSLVTVRRSRDSAPAGRQPSVNVSVESRAVLFDPGDR